MTARKVINKVINKAAPSKQQKKKKQSAPRARPPYFSKLVYDVSEAADALGISVPTLNRLIYRVPAELRSMKIGNRRCIPVSAITEYIEQRVSIEAQKYPQVYPQKYLKKYPNARSRGRSA